MSLLLGIFLITFILTCQVINYSNSINFSSGLGSVFGSRILTKSGYILNNVLDLDNKHQHINQTGRIVSLHLPFIAVETEKICGRRLISGSADVRDGVEILLSMLKTDPEDIFAVNDIPRFRFNNSDIEIEYPNEFPKEIKELLVKYGYHISEAHLPYPTSNVIQKVGDKSIAFSDIRGSGQSITI